MDGMTFGRFAQTIIEQKNYVHPKRGGGFETWAEAAHRVASHVLGAVDAPQDLVDEAERLIRERKFMPGGRYLYATGKPFHQTQNCLLLRACDSRWGWGELAEKSTLALMTGAGIGVVYSDLRGEGATVRGMGGTSTGPIALMQMVNELGRGIMQGGSRRAAIWAGLQWDHSDCMKFIHLKDWIPEVRALKEKDFLFPATMDHTNISVILNTEFFRAYSNDRHHKHTLAHAIYWETVRQMLKTGEPGFSIDAGKHEGENLRNACVPGTTEILTEHGYKAIAGLVGKKVRVWNGLEWSTVEPRVTGHNEPLVNVTLDSGQTLRCTLNHKFIIRTDYVGGTERIGAAELKPGDVLAIGNYPVIEGVESDANAYAQGFIAGDGMDGYNWSQIYAPKAVCLERLSKSVASVHPEQNGRARVTWAFSPRPKSFVPPVAWTAKSRVDWLAGLLDADATIVSEGSVQLCSIDRVQLAAIQKMLTTLGCYSKVTQAQPAGVRSLPDGHGGKADFYCQTSYRLHIGVNAVQTLMGLGMKCERLDLGRAVGKIGRAKAPVVLSVEPAGIEAEVYCFNEPLQHAGVFEGILTGQCTEITSADTDDICNLGSLNLARLDSVSQMERAVEVATAFLLAGTVYSHVPYPDVDKTRSKNRRLGLGLMGVHEFLLMRNQKYGEPSQELDDMLTAYRLSEGLSRHWADKWSLSRPVATRAVAPTGSIGIAAETTTGIEPIYCAAYKRRFLKGTKFNFQFVLDPTAKRLVSLGVNPESIEDAYSLAGDVRRRLAMQSRVQESVDHAISSTINLPAWGTSFNNEDTVKPFGNLLMEYLPNLRGVTVYPDGARGGQPLSPVSWREATQLEGETFVEQMDVCDVTRGGSCGS